ncbi:MAG TPA: hypothetical protein VK624_05460, partial [Steroidobacteraceae bacterium]|nr:hypothetical protein [Steroidobacteraceae bacterium]
MDSDIARSLPDLALIVRRDGIILSCVGGNAVRGLNAPEDEIPGRNVDALFPESIATHLLQTVRRILKTRKTAQQRYQDGNLALEMRFQVQGFDRVLVVCRDLGAGTTSNDSGLYPSTGGNTVGAMLPHRDGFEKSLRMALDMAALREDAVGVVLIHIGSYVTYQHVFGFEQPVGQRGIEHVLIGDVAADVNEHDTHGVFAQRGHVEGHAQRFFEAITMRQHGADGVP